jgi:hypothetical protein
MDHLIESYRGFEIVVAAETVPEQTRFMVTLKTRKDGKDQDQPRPIFGDGRAFPDVNTALRSGIKIGKQEIDALLLGK